MILNILRLYFLILMKILIVDDHALFRDGLSHVLNALEKKLSILEASDYERALIHVAENIDLDLVLLDLNMPGKDGFSALDTIAEHYPALPIIIISASNQQKDIQRALDAGAMGYIPKDTTSAIMLNAIRLVLSGGVYAPQNNTQNISQAKDQISANLTPRQIQVLALLTQGLSNKEIARQMSLAEGTVKMHITSILKGLGVNNRTQAAMVAEKLGLATQDS